MHSRSIVVFVCTLSYAIEFLDREGGGELVEGFVDVSYGHDAAGIVELEEVSRDFRDDEERGELTRLNKKV